MNSLSVKHAMSEAETLRCGTCGMMVAPDDGWRAGTTGEAFDSPKCLFRHHHERGAVSDGWVIEYYSQERRPASGLFYVVGSDLEGPMGRDFVPIATREQAEQLRVDHHGDRVLAFEEITEEEAAALFRPRP